MKTSIMKTSSAPRLLFILCGVVIVFLLGGNNGIIPMLGPAVAPSVWLVKQPCSKPAPGRFGCHILQRVPPSATAVDSIRAAIPFGTLRGELRGMFAPWRVYAQSAAPPGLRPADIQDAYKLNIPPVYGQPIPTVAVIVAYDNPNIEADLGVYRSAFGLPPCTTANGCFKKINQYGNVAPLPVPNQSWASEAALAVDMVSAACPGCGILLVEAQDSLNDGLFIAVPAAASRGAAVILAAYGEPEDFGAPAYEDEYFKRSGIAFVAPSGNTGFGGGVQFPASSQYVTAVGGTTLTRAPNARGWSESVWGSPATSLGTGSGCSVWIDKPAAQSDTGCRRRTVGDVAAVADPNTGVAVYDSYGANGWVVDGGTDVAAAIVAGVYGLAASFGPLYDLPVQYPYATPSGLFDVTSGSNGTCGSSYLCTAQPGYDGPTGLGTPNGVTAFRPPVEDFSFSIVPSQSSVDPGGATVTAVVTPQVSRGPAERISLTTRILSPGISAAISPSTIETGSAAVLTVSSLPETQSGSYQVEVIAKGVQATHTGNYTLTIRPLRKVRIDISVAPVSIQRGQSATLTWSTTDAPESCIASGAWSGPQPFKGTLTVSPAATGTYDYSLICYNPLGYSSATATLTVTPRPPVVTIAVNPARVASGQTAQLSWDVAHANTCLASDNWTGSKPVTGQQEVAPKVPGTYRYTLTCTGKGGTVSSSAVLSVQPVNQ